MKNMIYRKDWVWGVNGHNRVYRSYPEKNLEKQIKLAAGLGVSFYRFNFNPITEDDYKYLDKVVALTKENGLDIMLVMDDMMLDDSLEALNDRYTTVAKRYAGIIPYIQVFNEVDVFCMVDAPEPGNGFEPINFNKARLEQMLPRFKTAINAIKATTDKIKTVINISYQHTYLFDYLVANGICWDITGLDWYKNMYWKDQENTGYEMILPRLVKRYPQDIIICETNIWPDQKKDAESYFNDTEYLPTVMSYVSDTYDRVKGMIFYELLDEPQFENDSGKYDGESHFGLVLNDKDGNPGDVKPIYNKIKDLLNSWGE